MSVDHKALRFGSCMWEKPLVNSGVCQSYRLYFPLTRIIFSEFCLTRVHAVVPCS